MPSTLPCPFIVLILIDSDVHTPHCSNYGSPTECTSDVPIAEYKAYVVRPWAPIDLYIVYT